MAHSHYLKRAEVEAERKGIKFLFICLHVKCLLIFGYVYMLSTFSISDISL